MKVSVWRRLDTFARHLMPCALTFAMLIAGVVPLHIPAFQSVSPALPLIAVFYWTLYRPDLMPAAAAFAIGLLQDILSGLPVGITGFVLICVHAVVNTQRRFFIGKSFGVVWLGFGIVALGALGLAWLVTCLYYGALVAVGAVAFQTLITIGCFPVLCWALLRCQLSLLDQV